MAAEASIKIELDKESRRMVMYCPACNSKLFFEDNRLMMHPTDVIADTIAAHQKETNCR